MDDAASRLDELYAIQRDHISARGYNLRGRTHPVPFAKVCTLADVAASARLIEGDSLRRPIQCACLLYTSPSPRDRG